MHWLERHWYRIGVLHIVLWPLSLSFRLLVALRRLAYRLGLLPAQALPVPVIVVGNISVGGTGKTPLVLWLVDFLRAQGYHPAVISRGYGGSTTHPMAVSAATDPFLAGDEPVLIARRSGCPVWVGADRVAAAQALLRGRPDSDVLICDDGLQHYRLRRDVEIAVIDGERGFGNGQLLPAGPLREPLGRLAETDIVVTHGGIPLPGSVPMRLTGRRFRNLQDPARTVSKEFFHGQLLHAVAGIGNPARFFAQLERMGLTVAPHAFPDHHAYRPADLQFAGTAVILMTEKDAVKCMAFAQPQWWYLEVEAEVGEALGHRLLQMLRK